MASDDGDVPEGTFRLAGEPPLEDRLSPEAVRELYAAYGAELLAFLVGVLRDKSSAQDVSQITFRRVLEGGHMARDETVKGWIFKVALREALVYRRQTARQDRHLKEYSLDRETVLWMETSEDELVRDENVARIRHLLTQLPADQQYVVRQRIYEDKTFAVIANELNVPLGTVLTRMRLALEKVRKWFGND